MARRSSIAIAGAGFIGTVHALAAKHLKLPIAALASRDPEAKAGQAEQFRTTAVGYDELPAGADVVVVATPPWRHLDDTLAALRAGAGVLVEKPLCCTLDEADQLVAAGNDRIAYAENLLFAPIITDVVRRVRALGPLTSLEVRTLQSRPEWGGFFTREWGGGALFDLGIHPLAIAVVLAGEPVVGVDATLVGADDHPTDEHADVTLHFASGRTAHVVASWQGPADGLWDLQASSETGVVRAELRPEIRLEVNGEDIDPPSIDPELGLLEGFGYVEQLRSSVADLTGGTRPALDAEFGRLMLDISCASYHSGRVGERVAVPFAGPRDRTPLELWRPEA
jgi:myo-inositol 2-dehydrogenase / D-chiro-inositol 1-dehydrogenase